jgi:hypothetical protein
LATPVSGSVVARRSKRASRSRQRSMIHMMIVKVRALIMSVATAPRTMSAVSSRTEREAASSIVPSKRPCDRSTAPTMTSTT